MANVRTTVSLRPEVYEGAKSRYEELGFSTFGDLVNHALREYLHRQRMQINHKALERAAASPAYRGLLGQISDNFQDVDSEGLGPEY